METAKRIKRWIKYGEAQEPTKVDVFLTERCNLRCQFCNYASTPMGAAEHEMSDKKIMEIIEEICAMNIKIFGVLGGEPFLRKHILLEAMEKIKKHGISGSMVTNGTLINKKDVERIVKMEWDLIRFSIDGLKDTHDRLRGVKGCFDKVMSTIACFHETKRKLNSNFPTVEVNFVLTRENYKELVDLIPILANYGVKFVYVLPMIELTERSKELKITKDELPEVEEWLSMALDKGEMWNIRTNIKRIIHEKLVTRSNKMESVILSKKRKVPCFLPWYTINITADGIATPCAQWPVSDGIRLDNMSLREAWFHGFEMMRNRIKTRRLPEWCSRCCIPLVDENREIENIVGL